MKRMKSRSRKTLSCSVFYERGTEGGYVALVPALPGCHTQGESLEEAERNVKERPFRYISKVWLPTASLFPRKDDRFRQM
jgi:hypothetical protein